MLFTLIVSGAIAAPLAAQQTPAPSRNESAQAAAPSAQTPQASAPAAPQAQTPRAPLIGLTGGAALPGATNLKLEVTLTDTLSGAPVKKTISMVMLNGHAGMIRTANPEKGAVLNVDAVANGYQTGQVSLRLTFEYRPQYSTDSNGRPTVPPTLNESINVVLMDGVSMLLSESADPVTDRKVTLEA
ncbi:MAG: hypothetical protein AMXMBFR57_38700 [Acidimicrobiia bacterium]